MNPIRLSKSCFVLLFFVLISESYCQLLKGSKVRHNNVDFNAGTHFRNEVKGENGDVAGEYGFRTPDGCMHFVRYETIKNNYRILATDKRDCNTPLQKPTTSPAQSDNLAKINSFLPRVESPFESKKTFVTPKTILASPRTSLVTPKTIPFVRNRFAIPLKTAQKNAAPVNLQQGKPFAPNPAIITTTQRSTTTPKLDTTPRPKSSPPKQNSINKLSGKQLVDSVPPPANMKRPKVLSPDDPDPIYSFGYEAPGHGHSQAGLPDGTKKGEYFFDSLDGWRRIVTYVATDKGFFPKLRRVRIPNFVPPNAPGPIDRKANPGKKTGGRDDRNDGDKGRSDILGAPAASEGPGGPGEPGGPAASEGPGGPAASEGPGGPGGPGEPGGLAASEGPGGPGGPGGNGIGGNENENGNGDEREFDGHIGKQLDGKNPVPTNGCPYYFYTNTKINFHWERCLENATRVGAYGHLADDGYAHNVQYYADARGYHPFLSRKLLTREQQETVADFTEGAFIIPKIDEEKKETERRIQEWVSQNQDRIDNPL